ncbi:MAG: polysaccharide biosynthesis tyrosine autokinase [Planctomycetaceae bacterium]|nr:polysaccharide biosynthesis tyrosine autokinase [Planctomycetaceae bacterium]
MNPQVQRDPYQSADASEASPGPDPFDALIRFLHVINRRRMIVIYAVAAAVCVAVIYFKRIPEQYSSSASLMIRQLSTDPKLETSVAAHGLLSSYKQLLLSDPVLISTVENLQVRPPELAGKTDRSKWPAALRNMLKVSFSSKDNILEASCLSRDPASTVHVLETLTTSSSKFMEDFQHDMSHDLVTRLDGERRELEERLFERERQLLTARKECGDIGVSENSDEPHPLVQRVVELNNELTSVRRRRLEMQAMYSSIVYQIQANADLTQTLQKLASIVGPEALQRIPGQGTTNAATVRELQNELQQMETELTALRRHYGEKHAEIVRRQSLVNAQQKRLTAAQQEMQYQLSVGLRDPRVGKWMLETVQAELTTVQQYEASLQYEFSSAEAQALALSDKLADIRVAEREVATLRQLHESLLNRLSAIDIGQGHGGFRVAVLTEPLTPTRPVYPILSTIIFQFSLAAIALSVGAIYVMDLLDDRLRSPEEVRDQLQLSVLGIIRKLPEAELKESSLYVHSYPQTVQSECFRTLRTSLALSTAETNCIAVTSTEPGEGKTTLTANLATAFAQTGHRTLLIDADMRRPGLTKLFELRAKPGLSDILRAEADIAEECRERIIATDVPLLEMIPCGPRTQNAGLLLSMPALADMIDWAVSEYDQVIVDCPPSLAVSDAAMIGRCVDGTLFLLNPKSTNRRSVLRAVQHLRSMGLNLLGVVVNSMQEEKGSDYGGYGYGYGYGYGSKQAYGEDDEFMDQPEGDNSVDNRADDDGMNSISKAA